MSAIASNPPIKPAEVFYPAEDDEPLAETFFHLEAIIQLRECLYDLLAGRSDVFIGCDQFWYWEEGNPRARRAPDIMVVFGVRRFDQRPIFKSWDEGAAVPSFICEFSSASTWKIDLGEKFDLYERLGVHEYVLFDPEELHLRPPLQGWRLEGGRYRPIRALPDDSLPIQSLNVRFRVEESRIRLIDAATNEPIPTRQERLAEVLDLRQKLKAAEEEMARLRARMPNNLE